jgi:hypothetical protein
MHDQSNYAVPAENDIDGLIRHFYLSSGMSEKVIARKMGLAVGFVIERIDALSIRTTPPKFEPAKPRREPLPIPPREDLEQLLLEKVPIAEIARNYKTSWATAKKWLAFYDIGDLPTRKKIPVPPKSELEELYLRKRLKHKDIANTTG